MDLLTGLVQLGGSRLPREIENGGLRTRAVRIDARATML
jgi:hypothetical protein